MVPKVTAVASSTPSPSFTPTVIATPTPAATIAITPTVVLTSPPLRALSIERVFPNLEFRNSTNLVQPDEEFDRLFVTEQGGRILVFPNQQDAAEPTLFLDLSSRANEGHLEEGLLGLAFDPSFQENGYFYVYYSASNPRRSVISRFLASQTDPNSAQADSELIIMEILQPAGNHNGGQLAFGPDGYLYVGLGDGGLGGDPYKNGQNKETLLGSILRIDVSNASESERYRVPSDNPMLGVASAKAEVWAYGLRNPWRFSFDPQTGALWAADVGQSVWEEIDIIEKGQNYGWNIMEGTDCFSPNVGCDESGLRLPLAQYGRGRNCAIIGGYVYRGDVIPSLIGAYVYGDYCSGKIWALRSDGQRVTEFLLLVDSELMITSFGVDRSGNLYVVSPNSGIYRLVPRD